MLADNFRDIAHIYSPDAIICADPFHVTKNRTEAFDKVRIRCRNNTKDENMQYLLTKFKYVFNFNKNLDTESKWNKRYKRYMNYRGIITLIFDNFPELKKAYDLKNQYLQFNKYSDFDHAKDDLTEIIIKFGESGIKEYEKFITFLLIGIQRSLTLLLKSNK